MATHSHVTFTCDAPDCKSRCQSLPEIPIQDPNVLAVEFKRRGWLVLDGKHYCPFHAQEVSKAAPEPAK